MKLSIAVPVHNMPNKDFFLGRLLDSLDKQTFRDFEVVVTAEGKMAENTNAAIKKSKGELIKILYMDDYLAHENSLQEIVDAWQGGWLVSGCQHDDGVTVGNPHMPTYNSKIKTGNNTIGSPSVLTIENVYPLLFDEEMSWLLDCDYYHRLYERFGEPTILPTLNVNIGIGDHQTTHIMTNEQKLQEHNYIHEKYA